ncbi:MAG: TonB family protein, partial [Bacteroidaceae bacterium]|nr:TonB family protein [Bacteroidaceae bacterium]
TDKSTIWKSTNTKVATVSSNGKVTGIKSGNVAIIASAMGKDAYCNVNVIANNLEIEDDIEWVDIYEDFEEDFIASTEDLVEYVDIYEDFEEDFIASTEDLVEYVDITEVEEIIVEEEPEEETIFMVVEERPEFPGGQAALMEYLRKNIKYPAICRENNIQGRVLIQFVVNRDGSIVDPEVVRSVEPHLDKEALRVISSMPKWKPGLQRGKPVRVKFTVPVNFKLS